MNKAHMALKIGTAAEHIVCADLLLAGYNAFMTGQHCPYDVAVQIGARLIRIQVKGTMEQRSIPNRDIHVPAYVWNVRRAGKKQSRLYGVDEFDILALVALDIRKIAYMPPSRVKQTIHIRPPGAIGGKKHFDLLTFLNAINGIIGSQSDISHGLFRRIGDDTIQ